MVTLTTNPIINRMKITISNLRRIIRETLEQDIEYQIRATSNDLKDLIKADYSAPEDIEEIKELARIAVEETSGAMDDSRWENWLLNHFNPISVFIKSKRDDESEEFTVVELQAVARVARISTEIAKKILGIYFKYVGRQPDKSLDKSFRGVTSSKHGSHPFAGNAGGSGMGWGADGPVGFGMGGGVGAMGGGKPWVASDPKSLPMGSRRR